jgi:DNA processing protein
VPGSIFSENSRGTHHFLKLGATPITTPDDLLQALNLAPREKRQILRSDVTADEMRILDALANPIPRDELLEVLELPISEANILLSMMEIKGLIVEELGVIRIK